MNDLLENGSGLIWFFFLIFFFFLLKKEKVSEKELALSARLPLSYIKSFS